MVSVNSREGNVYTGLHLRAIIFFPAQLEQSDPPSRLFCLWQKAGDNRANECHAEEAESAALDNVQQHQGAPAALLGLQSGAWQACLYLRL